MVAITVILAAVIGSFVLGIGGDITETPQVRLGVSDASENIDGGDNDIFVIKHSGGDTIKKDNVNMVINNMSDGGAKLTEIEGIQSDISVGDRIVVSETDNIIKGTAELRIRLVHKPSDNLLFDVTIIVN
jgi:FlaG/FlaF family flagellin (archaellin)